jgi:hypothetical protein
MTPQAIRPAGVAGLDVSSVAAGEFGMYSFASVPAGVADVVRAGVKHREA